jgi:glyoxylase-like metal-dependent hydrolase (beta-lactamase superfamily II)
MRIGFISTCSLAIATPVFGQAAPAGPSARSLIERAVQAIGGAENLRGITTTVTEFNSASFGLGQEETPLSPARGPIAWGRISVDWRGNRRAAQQEARQVTGQVTRTRQVVAGSIGMNEAGGTQNPMAPGGVAGVLQGMRLAPERLLLRALENPGSIRRIPARSWRGETMNGVRFAEGGDTVSLFFDNRSGLLTVAENLTDDPILGDRRGVTWYTRWQDAGGVKFPRQFDSEANGRLLSQNIVTSLTVNTAIPDSVFAIPDSIARRAQRAPATPTLAPVTVTLVELAPGVWRAEGGTHHSLVVDQGSQLVVVEAPQNARRTNAVLDTVKARFRTKPIGLVVNTHHHWDHAGGVRAAMAAGHRIATHSRNAAFVRGIATARKTVAPDALSRGRAAPAVVSVADSMSIGSGPRRVVLYELPSSHGEGILAAYLPEARLLFASDVLSPPAAGTSTPLAAVGSAELVAMARGRGIIPERFVGGHGGIVAWNEVERAARP